MSREMKRATFLPGPGALVFLGPVPANHKYEVIQVSVGTDSAQATKFYEGLIDVTPTLFFLDEIAVAAGVFGTVRNYNGLVVLPGEYWYSSNTATAGHPLTMIVTYIDVDLTN